MKKIIGFLIFLAFVSCSPGSSGKQQGSLTPRQVKELSGYGGECRFINLKPEEVALLEGNLIEGIRIVSDDGDFPELQILTVEGDYYGLIIRDLISLLDLPVSDKDNSGNLDFFNPRIIKLDGERTGVIYILPGVVGTGIEALFPLKIEGRYMMIHNVRGIEYIEKTEKNRKFVDKLIKRPVDFFQDLALLADKAASASNENAVKNAEGP
ncbi:MAG: hypothetical protein JW969_05710 [Spirochaetales bacterium]|nr:hypothetical protein [Spirochaetales bacterium]